MVQSPQNRHGTEEQSVERVFKSKLIPQHHSHTRSHRIEKRFGTPVLVVSQNDNLPQRNHENIKSPKFMSSPKLSIVEDNNLQENLPPSEFLKNKASRDLFAVSRPIDSPSRKSRRKSRNRGAIGQDDIRYRLSALISPPRKSIRRPFTYNKTPKKSDHTPKQWTLSPRKTINITPRKSPRNSIITPILSPRISITPRRSSISYDRRPEKAKNISPIEQVGDKMDSMHIRHISERKRSGFLHKPIPEEDKETHAKKNSMWYYVDHEDSIRGPYTPKKMRLWFEEGYLPMDLKVQRSVDFNKNKEFKFLVVHFLEGDKAFLDHVPDICYNSKDGKKQSEADKSRYKIDQSATVRKPHQLSQHDPRQKQRRQRESEDREYSAQSQQNIFPQYQKLRNDSENVYPEYEIENSKNSGHQTQHPSASLTQFQESVDHPFKERLWTESSSEAPYDNKWLPMEGQVTHQDVHARPRPQLPEWGENAQYPSVQGQVETFPLYDQRFQSPIH